MSRNARKSRFAAAGLLVAAIVGVTACHRRPEPSAPATSMAEPPSAAPLGVPIAAEAPAPQASPAPPASVSQSDGLVPDGTMQDEDGEGS